MEQKIGIVGGGIAGLSLAIALQQHNIKSVIYEKDLDFQTRNQGYGLTLQQGGKALKSLKLLESIRKVSCSSLSHFIFDSEGRIVVYWGVGRTLSEKNVVWNANRNLHISRQALRRVLLEKIDKNFVEIKWDSQFVGQIGTDSGIIVETQSGDKSRTNHDLVSVLAGCDGIFSKVRNLVTKHDPLNYLNVFVMLGIFDTAGFELFMERVVQMSDGDARIFMMPFDEHRTMWQLSFPMASQDDAIFLSKSAQKDLLEEARKRCKKFCSPIPEILDATMPELVTGYPVYDRDPLKDCLDRNSRITLLGDAAHPMSPFKGQGANQALLDAVNLAQVLKQGFDLRDADQIPEMLRGYEKQMIDRTKTKILSSRESVSMLHNPDFVRTSYQLERRGFNEENNKDMLRNLRIIQEMPVFASDPSNKLDLYAFASI